MLTAGTSETKIVKAMNQRAIKNFLDIIVMAKLRNGVLSGYDFISFVHSKYHFLLSSGTIYSLLYSLERKGLIKGAWTERKRVYNLTEKGTKTIETILHTNNGVKVLVNTLLFIN